MGFVKIPIHVFDLAMDIVGGKWKMVIYGICAMAF